MSEQPPLPTRDQTAFVLPAQTLLLVAVAAVFFTLGLLAGMLTMRGSGALSEAQVAQIVQDAVRSLPQTPAVDRFALVDDDPSQGPADAPVVIVEFSAYGCPYCKQFHDETLPSILANYGSVVRYVYRDMPTVAPEVSFPAAMAAECANDQGKFWQYHDALFARQAELSGPTLADIATTLQLNMDTFSDCMETSKYYDEVNADFMDGTVNGVTTTPNFFINGEHYTGAQPYSFFESVIENELFKAGVTR